MGSGGARHHQAAGRRWGGEGMEHGRASGGGLFASTRIYHNRRNGRRGGGRALKVQNGGNEDSESAGKPRCESAFP